MSHTANALGLDLVELHSLYTRVLDKIAPLIDSRSSRHGLKRSGVERRGGRGEVKKGVRPKK